MADWEMMESVEMRLVALETWRETWRMSLTLSVEKTVAIAWIG